MRSDVRVDMSAKGRRIYLNGVLVPHCVMADEEEGVIERWETDEQGRVKAFFDDAGKPAPRLVFEYGVVRIEPCE